MTNQTETAGINMHTYTSFGIRLKAARETMGMDIKEAASQLRLPERTILALETGEYDSNLPLMFIRGYIRNYSKLMNIPENEVKDALLLLQPQPAVIETEAKPVTDDHQSIHHRLITKTFFASNRINDVFITLSKYLIPFIVILLAAIWWHSHKNTTTSTITPIALPKSIPAAPVAATPIPVSLNARSGESDIPLNSKSTQAMTDSAKAITNSNMPQTKTFSSSTTTTEHPLFKKIPHLLPYAHSSFLSHYISNDSYLFSLIDFILVLLILSASMHIYAKGSTTFKLAKHKKKQKPLYFISTNKLFSSLPLHLFANKKSILAITMTAAAVIIGLTTLSRYNHAESPTTASLVEKTILDQNQITEQNIQWDDEISRLMPDANLNAAIFAAFKTNVIQNMIYQLNEYKNEADAIKFSLTDPSTSIGEFTYKKKKRRHYRRPAYYYQ